MIENYILKVSNLSVSYPDGTKAIDSISFNTAKGEILGVIGESGSGKSTILNAILKLVPENTQIDGSIEYEGKNILEYGNEELNKIRGKKIGLVFQDTLSAFDPVMKVGDQIIERTLDEGLMERADAKQKAVQIMQQLGITFPDQRMKAYPHELSGGLRQRAFITMILFQNPEVILLDEPTTALDVIAQAQLIELIKKLKEDGISLIFITHDIALASGFCDNLLVLYAGKISEYGRTKDLLTSPKHPYTAGLIKATPTLSNFEKSLEPMKGLLPNPKNIPDGCRFWPRCKYADEICKVEEPAVKAIDSTHVTACHFPEKVVLS